MGRVTLSAATAFAITIGAFGLAHGQTPSSEQAQPMNVSDQTQTRTGSSNPAGTMTFVGCLVKETDYRAAHNLGKGALGGAGLGDEFVLVDATMTPAPAAAGAPEAIGTSGTSPSAAAVSCT